MKIAITGTIGGGKSSVSRILMDKGYSVHDTDKMVHTYYDKGGRLENVVIEMFGEDVLDETGKIDRTKLGNIVFTDFSKLSQLESKVYPIVSNHVAELYDNSDDLIFFEVPMLFESHLEDSFDLIIMVTAPLDIRMSRLKERGMSEEDVVRRSKRHLDETKKIEKSDIIINNDGDYKTLSDKIELLIKEIEGR